VIMFAMLFGHLPFEEEANAKSRITSSLNVYQLYQYISTHSLALPTHTKISTEAADLLKGLLKCDPNKRLNLTQVFRHLWFANVNFK
jgi:serine/threonine protein kinase